MIALSSGLSWRFVFSMNILGYHAIKPLVHALVR